MAAGLILGMAIGAVGGIYAKDKLMGGNANQDNKQQEIDSLTSEINKLSERNKEAERQVEDLLAENQKLRRQTKDNDDSRDDLEDDLADAKKLIQKLRLQNEDLARELKEYKAACNNYEIEIQRLKDK